MVISVNAEPTPGYLVWRLSIKWRVAVDRALAPLGLTHAQYTLLASLYGMERAGQQPTQRELADHTGLEALYASKLARALDAEPWLGQVLDVPEVAEPLNLPRQGIVRCITLCR